MHGNYFSAIYQMQIYIKPRHSLKDSRPAHYYVYRSETE